MTKGRVATSIRGRQIGWTEKKQQIHLLRFGPYLTERLGPCPWPRLRPSKARPISITDGSLRKVVPQRKSSLSG